MALTDQQYADLSAHSYDIPIINDIVTINHKKYDVLEYYSDEKTDYQGTIYQNIETGDIIVAHRGTEASLGDALADAEMAIKFTNPQIPHALKLTERALELAKLYAEDNNIPVPEVSITGHSLGGALTQVTAYEYGLKGVTFNAYGAANLTYKNLEGDLKKVPHIENDKITNHMMAGDTVNIGNDHIGKSVMYMRQEDLSVLQNRNYGDNSRINNRMVRATYELMVPLNSHGITNFTPTDDGPSILSLPDSRERAEQNMDIISEYRSEVRNTKDIIETVALLTEKSFVVPLYVSGKAYEGATYTYEGLVYVGEKAYEGAAYVGEKAYEGAAYVGEKAYDGITYVYEGATYVAGKAYEGAAYVGEKAYDGAAYVGEKAYDGVAYVGGKAYDGAAYVGGKAYEGAAYLSGKILGIFSSNDEQETKSIQQDNKTTSIETGSQTVDLLLASLEKSMNNPNGFDLNVMLATLETKEGKEFTANIDKGADGLKVAEASIETDIQSPIKSKGMGVV